MTHVSANIEQSIDPLPVASPAGSVPPVLAADPAPPMSDAIVQFYAEWGSVIGRLGDELLERRAEMRLLIAVEAGARVVLGGDGEGGVETSIPCSRRSKLSTRGGP